MINQNFNFLLSFEQSARINESVAQMLRAEAFDILDFATYSLPVLFLVAGALIGLIIMGLATAFCYYLPERTQEPEESRDFNDSSTGVHFYFIKMVNNYFLQYEYSIQHNNGNNRK